MTTKPEKIADAKIIEIPIEKLDLDKNNVRFSHYKKQSLSQSQIQEIIRQDGDTNVLCDQILAAGVVYEPLVIDSDYIVIEGNRRLVCLRLLLADIDDGKLDEKLRSKFLNVKCRILPKSVDNKTLDLYLATIHVKGKKMWKLFNRANHIYRLSRIHGVSYDRLADELGMGKATIQRCVIVYKHLMGYSRTFPDDKEWFHKFTYFDFLFKRKDLKELREDEEFVTQFAKWVHDKKFHDVRDIFQLAKVVTDHDAFEELKKNNFKSALEVLERKDPSLSNPEFKQIKETLFVLKDLTHQDPNELKQNKGKMKLLIQLQAEIKSLMLDLDSEFPEEVITR